MKIRTIALASGALVTALILAGCSTPVTMDPGPTAEASAANSADIAFAMEMIVHHEQAIEMADIVLGKDGVDPRVTDLATAVKEAQGPEIDTMSGWLEQWGVDPGMGGMDHGGGTMTDADMSSLEAASGPDASRLFLEQMIVHHQGAIEMAQLEADTGENPDAVALAQKIIDDQTAEIALMNDLLAAL